MKRQINSFTPYFITNTAKGYYFSDNNGFIFESDDAIEIALGIIKFAKRYKKDIEKYNIKKHIEIENEMNNHRKTFVKPKPKKKSHIYFLKCGDYYKIGISKDVNRRIKELDKRPFKIEVIYISDLTEKALEIEQTIHSSLERFRINGEWYNLPKGIIKIVCKAIKQGVEESEIHN